MVIDMAMASWPAGHARRGELTCSQIHLAHAVLTASAWSHRLAAVTSRAKSCEMESTVGKN